jgi:dethiobiotin synthetase
VKGVFVTGTDTGVGKTVVTAGIVNALASKGIRVAGLKPVVSGARETPEGPVWEDVVALASAGGEVLSIDQRAPYRFNPPCAPDLAARQAGTTITLSTLLGRVGDLEDRVDYCVVEGVGGLRVPLGPNLELVDWVAASGFPVLVVVGIRLGCINHALLTAEIIHQRDLPWLGWVANHVDPLFCFGEDAVDSIAARLGPPAVELPSFQGELRPEDLASLASPFCAEWVKTLL